MNLNPPPPVRPDARPLLRRGFNLVEILIVVAILAILAGIVFPRYQSLSREARAKSLATNVHKIREQLQVHRNSGEFPINAAGVPLQVHGAWFRNGKLPEHTWTGEPMVVDVAAAGGNSIYPAVKTFDPAVAGAVNAWYNTDNGQFCALIPAQADDAETLEVFNVANASEAAALNQTTR